MDPDLGEIFNRFETGGKYLSARRYGSGHINDTFVVASRSRSGEHRCLLQRVNRRVFADPAGLMANIAAVTGHLRRRVAVAGGDPDRESLTLIPAREGSSHVTTEAGDCWRGFVFIDGARTYDRLERPEHALAAGRAFGTFQRRLSDFPAGDLSETIPDFHDTRRRFEALRRAVAEDIHGRARTARPEIEFILRREALTPRLVDLQAKGRLPLRVTHNDTKFNNVMIDDLTGEGVCVIDLDTVMPGLAACDFGDAIRSLANTAAEDETDLSKVNFSLEVFDAFARGYLQATARWLEPDELAVLPFAAELMTLECGMRFLADYLQGDTYFKTGRLAHNLDRTRTQLRLVEEMEAAEPAMAESVRRWAKP